MCRLRISKQSGVVLAAVVIGILILGGCIVLARTGESRVTTFDQCVQATASVVMESFPRQCAYKGKTFESAADRTSVTSGWSAPTPSGKGGFVVSFPDGWGGIVRSLEEDTFYIPGPNQPLVSSGPAAITDTERFGGDRRMTLTIILGNNFAAPQGVPSTFLLNKDATTAAGTKYVYEYPEDTVVGIGYARLKGDRDYRYVFAADDGKELHVTYSVYGVDPRNMVETVDALVQTIRLTQ